MPDPLTDDEINLPRRGLVHVEAEHLPRLIEHEPEEVLMEAQRAAEAIDRVIQSKPKPVIMNGQRYLEFEDWQTVGRFYGVTVGLEGEPEFVQYDDGTGIVMGFRATAVAMHHGKVVSRASGMCMNDEEKWNTRPKYAYCYVTQDGRLSEEDPGPDQIVWIPNPSKPGKSMPKKERAQVGVERVPLHQIASMAQTRACAKALRNVLSWVVVLAGYKPTPAEEMVEEGDEAPTASAAAAPKSKADAFLADKPELALALKVEHPTIQDIAGKLERYGSISEKQIKFVMDLAREHGQNQRAAELEEWGATYEDEPYATGFEQAAQAHAAGFTPPAQPFAITPAESVQVHELVRKSGGAVYRKGDERTGPKHVKLPQELVDELGPGYGTDFAIQSLTREKWDYLVQVLMEYARVASPAPTASVGAAGGKDPAAPGTGSTAAKGESRIPPAASGSTPRAKAAPQPSPQPKPVTPIPPITEENIPF